MAQEEKVKAYDGNYKAYTELINRLEDVKDAIKKQNYGIAINVLCKPYPEFQVTTHSELKESEDERIRKELISLFQDCIDGVNHRYTGSDSRRWLAWLEKQGEHSNFLSKIKIGDKVTRNEDGVLVNLSQLKRIAKPAEEYNITGIGSKHATGKLSEKIKELKPLNEILDKQGEQKSLDNVAKEITKNKETAMSFLKSTGIINEKGELADEYKIEQDEQNSTWSEEDEDYYDAIISKLEVTQDDALLTDNQMKFLKSLKDRYTWKPSDEQMQALSNAGNSFRPSEEGHKILWSLYNDLKKLREK